MKAVGTMLIDTGTLLALIPLLALIGLGLRDAGHEHPATGFLQRLMFIGAALLVTGLLIKVDA